MKRLNLLIALLFCIVTIGLVGCGDDDTYNVIVPPTMSWATGILDTDFDTDGILIIDIEGSDGTDRAHALGIQSDGKIVVAGSFWNGTDRDFAIARFNTDGSLDATFGTGGIVKTDISGFDDVITSLVIQSDGMIVVAGRANNGGSDFDFAAARYTTLGALDPAFGTGGQVTTDISGSNRQDRGAALGIQSDGKIVVAGQTRTGGPNSNWNFAVVRYTALGVLDTTFDADGIVTRNVGGGPRDDRGFALGIQSDGKIVVAGAADTGSDDDAAVVRFNTDGSLDNTFDLDGIVTIDINSGSDNDAYALGIQSDGKIVVAGSFWNGTDLDFAIARFNTDGSLDATLGTGGIAETDISGFDDEAHALGIQSDGRIVVAGWSGNGSDLDFGVVRYTSDGLLDTSFDTDGIVVTDISAGYDDYAEALGIRPNGKIVVVGHSIVTEGVTEDFEIAQYE